MFYRNAVLDRKLFSTWEKTVKKTSGGRDDSGRAILEASTRIFIRTFRDGEDTPDDLRAVMARIMSRGLEAADECGADPLTVLRYTMLGAVRGAIESGVDLDKTVSVVLYTALGIMSDFGLNGSDASKEIASAMIVGALDISMEAAVRVREAVRRVLS